MNGDLEQAAQLLITRAEMGQDIRPSQAQVLAVLWIRIRILMDPKLNIFFKKYALKYHENVFFIVGIVKERIFRVGSETGSVIFYATIQRGSESESKTLPKMRSESEANRFGSTTLMPSQTHVRGVRRQA
jgi:hypothetical protein